MAFVGVNVVPMDRPRVLRGVSVLVRNGIVAAIGKSGELPSDVQLVHGNGQLWLSPGLADMHNHCDSRQDMALMLAKGITTTLNMGEARNSFVGRLRGAIALGDAPGPRAFAALAVDGTPEYGHLVLETLEDVRAVVRLARTNRYDFIKVYNNLAPELFGHLAHEARAVGLPIVGHGVTKLGIARQLSAGQAMIAHAEEFFYTHFPPAPDTDPTAPPDTRQIAGAVELVRRYAAFVVADLVTYSRIAEQWGRPAAIEAFLRSATADYVAPTVRAMWPLASYSRREGSLARRVQFLQALVRAMNEAGVQLLSGTDAPDIPGVVPGFALHDNLHYLTGAGLSPYDALATATRNAGSFIATNKPGEAPFGTVSVGARADLILTSANPLDDLHTLTSPLGVLAAGRWYDSLAIEELLSSVRRTYAALYRAW
jgi:imidazolonepropionase-like amidohydrolase